MSKQPDFIICGAQKAGTTFLHRCLKEHPQIYMPDGKNTELHFFDRNFHKGINWYKSHFDINPNTVKICGEKTPEYMYFKDIPKRIYQYFPDIKLIFILRNPVDRAYSSYWGEIRKCRENLTFEEAIKYEDDRLLTGNISFQRYQSYKDKGKYVKQLKNFEKYFSHNQMLILLYDDLNQNPEKVLKDICFFLGVDSDISKLNLEFSPDSGKVPYSLKLQKLSTMVPLKCVKDIIKKINLKDTYPPMKPETRERLRNYFKPYNEELESYLNRELNW